MTGRADGTTGVAAGKYTEMAARTTRGDGITDGEAVNDRKP